MSNILFNKIRKVKSPSQAYGTAAAATDFFVPDYDNSFLTDLESKNPNKDFYECSVSPNLDSMTITVAPHGRINIPSGIRVIIYDTDTCLLAVNKSGVATKKGLVMSACLVDPDYQGEIHLGVINTGDEPVQIKTGEKLVQFMHLPVLHTFFQEVSFEDFDKLKPDSNRGCRGFGSSDTF
jgi:deoxyuridine 5'-triphosphate nucleotidohydrolase